MRALLVDDEPVARRTLREELEEVGAVEVVGEAANGQAALHMIQTYHPDVVFLDLQMPVMGGFETIAQLQGSSLPAIVILTAYDEFAIRAFEAGAIDYLLKPVGQARLRQTVERLKRIIHDPRQVSEQIARIQEVSPPSESATNQIRKIVGKHGEEYFLLNIDEILAFQAEGNLTWIVTPKNRYAATQNLKALEQKLKGSSFQRIHRNALINVNQIQRMSMITSQRWLVTLANGQQFVASKRLVKNIRGVLHW